MNNELWERTEKVELIFSVNPEAAIEEYAASGEEEGKMRAYLALSGWLAEKGYPDLAKEVLDAVPHEPRWLVRDSELD